MIAITRRTAFTCRASSNPKESSNNAKFTDNSKATSKAKTIFQNFHKKRSETVKKNSSDLTAISQKDLAEVNSFLKELDTFHREQFEEIKNAIKDRNDKKDRKDSKDSTDTSTVTEVTAQIVVSEVEGDADAENIFIKKD